MTGEEPWEEEHRSGGTSSGLSERRTEPGVSFAVQPAEPSGHPAAAGLGQALGGQELEEEQVWHWKAAAAAAAGVGGTAVTADIAGVADGRWEGLL